MSGAADRFRAVLVADRCDAPGLDPVSLQSAGAWESLIESLTIELNGARLRVQEIEATIDVCRTSQRAGAPYPGSDIGVESARLRTRSKRRTRRIWVD